MNKIKNIFTFVIFTLLIYSCGDDDNNLTNTNPFADVNYADLAVSDNNSIESFLKTHYYDSTIDNINLIASNEPSIFDDEKLIKMEITENEIDYKLYVYKIEREEGEPDPLLNKEFPTFVDSVFVNYTGIQLMNIDIDSDPFDSGSQVWLPSTIIGFAKGITNIQGGENITNNGPITYKDTGKAIFFIPSGLAYPSINFRFGIDNPASLPYDLTLVFKVELLDFVKNTDHDNDGTPSINEDKNEDGDPRNDFSDSNNPTIPDYLNPSISDSFNSTIK